MYRGNRKPNLEHHCRFFEALKSRCFGRPCSVWILTTNYDLLFETAAARTNVLLENGFCGATERYFYPAQFRNTPGEAVGRRFSPSNTLTVRLVKLHGSISWVEEESRSMNVILPIRTDGQTGDGSASPQEDHGYFEVAV